ncbi:MAG TPA: hypothetical protein VGO76_04210 [Luteibacter sp.]|jgi:hypothetical protein|nr:hypothetical protein [Luteibacter sp.]
MLSGYRRATGVVEDLAAQSMLRHPILTRIAAFLSIFMPFVQAGMGRPLPTNIGVYSRAQAWWVQVSLEGRQYRGWLGGSVGKPGDTLELVVHGHNLLAVYRAEDGALALPPNGGTGLGQFIRDLKYVAWFFAFCLALGMVGMFVMKLFGGIDMPWVAFGWFELAFPCGGAVVYLLLILLIFRLDLIDGLLTSIAASRLGVGDYWTHSFTAIAKSAVAPREDRRGDVFHWSG